MKDKRSETRAESASAFNAMEWPRLINDARLGLESAGARHVEAANAQGRSDFRRDYDRLVFSSPFRRLQNKTQVFPLPGSIFVHNRLTHSMEVACVGKSMADTVSAALRARYADRPWVNKLYHIGDITAAACLAHDLGNPPFGHSGEKAISTFFSEGAGRLLQSQLTERQWADLTNFEGNANSLRTLTHQFRGRRPGGFAMTYSTLASVVKYPYTSLNAGEHGKFGFFESEQSTFEHIARQLGLLRKGGTDEAPIYARHPLVYLVEAADDICYEVMDLEDAHKLKILTTDQVIGTLQAYFDDDTQAHQRQVMDNVDDPNEKISYLRSCVVGRLVDRCAQVFTENEDRILRGEFDGTLLQAIGGREGEAYKRSVELSWGKIYNAADVVNIELAGNRIITFLLEKLVDAVVQPTLNYSTLLLSQVPQQYDVNAPTLFGKIQAVLDHVSAMTDVYALDLYRRLNGMSLPAV